MTAETADSQLVSGLEIIRWAEGLIADDHSKLHVHHDPRPAQLHGAPGASGLGLVSNGVIGADLLRVPAGSGFVPHTHPGHHVLVVVGGRGTITYGGAIYETTAGEVYLIEGEVPHAVGAITDHVILAVGAPHRKVDSEDRMTPVPYEEVLAPTQDLHCLICELRAEAPQNLHAIGCEHCPCYDCLMGTPT
jgi:quercetin dioxygenase-like cupin family protein